MWDVVQDTNVLQHPVSKQHSLPVSTDKSQECSEKWRLPVWTTNEPTKCLPFFWETTALFEYSPLHSSF